MTDDERTGTDLDASQRDGISPREGISPRQDAADHDGQTPPAPELAATIATEAPDGILVVNEQGVIEWTNPRLTYILGYRPGSLVGSPVEVLLPAALRSAHITHRAEYANDPAVRPMGAGLDLEAISADGEVVPVEIALAPVDTPDGLRVVAVVRDITDRLAAESSLRDAEEALTIAAERERIARDLHDTVIQQLFATGLALQAAAARTSDSQIGAQLEVAVDELDATIRQVRNAIFELHTPSQGASLRRDVLDLARSASRVLGFEPVVTFDGPVDAATDDASRGALLASLQEALSNAARHAEASSVTVTVHAGRRVVLSVVDDGRGFDTASTPGSGLQNLRLRARELGGDCTISSGDGDGTTIEWWVPSPD